MNNLLENLTEEQKKQVYFGGAGLGIFIVFYAFFSLSSTVSGLETKVASEKKRLYTFAKYAADIKVAKGSGNARGSKRRGRSLISSINDSIRAQQISISRVNTSKDEKNAQVYLDEAPFGKLLLWLQDLQSGFNIRVENISISSVRDKPGLVKVNVKLLDLDAK